MTAQGHGRLGREHRSRLAIVGAERPDLAAVEVQGAEGLASGHEWERQRAVHAPLGGMAAEARPPLLLSHVGDLDQRLVDHARKARALANLVDGGRTCGTVWAVGTTATNQFEEPSLGREPQPLRTTGPGSCGCHLIARLGLSFGEDEMTPEQLRFSTASAVTTGATAPVRSGRFRIATSRDLDTVVVTVHGDLDVTGARHLGSVLADIIDGQDDLSVVVDLHDASAADTSGLTSFSLRAVRPDRRPRARCSPSWPVPTANPP